ncbi:MAG: carboxypeptidase-like regulatory domain-containing protein [Caldilineales bacterium]
MRHYRRLFGAFLIVALAAVIIWSPAGLTAPVSDSGQRSATGAGLQAPGLQESTPDDTWTSDPVTPLLTVDAASLPEAELEFTLDREINPRLSTHTVFDPEYNPDFGPDPLLQAQEAAGPAAPDAFGTPILNFNGQGYTFVNPPDTVGDAGTNHYVQMINGGGGALVRIYNKSTGATIGSQFALDNLAPSGACTSGAGDPIVLYDQAANRWLLSEFAGSGNHLCVYISKTADPGGQYWFYDFTTPNFPDYPHYGVWGDAYYVGTNESSPAAYALERSKMLNGQAAQFVRRTAPSLAGFGFQMLMPADLDGPTAPPSGSPGLFMRHVDTEAHNVSGYPNTDLLEVWAFAVNWSNTGASTFTKIATIQVAEFDSTLCGLTSFSCIPQPGTSVRLDPLREVIMNRLVYRNFSNRQVLVGNFSTDVGSDRAGVRWFELRKTSSNWSLFQEGTYGAGSLNRWMGGIAMDKSGNIALAYNVANSSTYPGIRYAGRLSTDPAGTLPQGEHTIVNGTGSNGSNRYGDYSAMSIDPSDDCTFWFTGEWNAGSQWSTRVAKFKFDQCGATPPPGNRKVWAPLVLRQIATRGTVTGRVTAASNGSGISGAQVCVLSSNQCTTSNASGYYTINQVLAGNQTVRATASGYNDQQKSANVPAGGTVTVNFPLTAVSPPRTITHSQSQAIVDNNSVSCNNASGHADNAYLREFNLNSFGISGAFNVTSVQFGVEYAEAGSGGSQPIRLRLYRKTNPAGSLTYGNLTTITTVNTNISDQASTRPTISIAGTAPAGSVLVVEVFTPNGQSAGNFFWIGSNSAGQTAPSYLAAPTCGISEPTTTASIGYPDMHIVMNVTGTVSTQANAQTEVTIGDAITAQDPVGAPAGDNQFGTRSSAAAD